MAQVAMTSLDPADVQHSKPDTAATRRISKRIAQRPAGPAVRFVPLCRVHTLYNPKHAGTNPSPTPDVHSFTDVMLAVTSFPTFSPTNTTEFNSLTPTLTPTGSPTTGSVILRRLDYN